MTWFRVDDAFPQHPKVLRIPRAQRVASVGLWTLAGGWCSRNLTDGHLDEHMVEELGGTLEQAEQLVRVGLWETTEAGYVFHDWADWQPTRAEIEAKREEEARRKADWRARRAAKRAGQAPDDRETDPAVPVGQMPDTTRDTTVSPDGVPPSVPPESLLSRPDPTRPGSPNGDLGSSEPIGSGRDRPPRSQLTDEQATTQTVVAAWIDRQRRRPASAVVGHVARHVKVLLSEDFTVEQITAGLVQMDAKGLHPSTLPSLVSAAVNAGVVRPIRPDSGADSGGTPQLSDAQIEDLLGPDFWTLPPPPFDPETTPVEQVRAWSRRQAAEHRAAREAEALAKLNRVHT